MMIIPFVVACLMGLAGGFAFDEMLRGRDPRSALTVAAGVAGAVAALVICRAVSNEGLMLQVLTALLGALLAAFATRVRVSATRVIVSSASNARP